MEQDDLKQAILSCPNGLEASFFEEIDSTQDQVKRLKDQRPEANFLVVAQSQTQGRGRSGKTWHSQPSKSLMFSLSLNPLAPEDLPLIPIAAGLSLFETARVGTLKWPNDWISPDGRKMSGVLAEAQFQGQSVKSLILGVGINVYGAPGDWAFVNEFAKISRAELLLGFLERFYLNLTTLEQDSPSLIAAYRLHCSTIGKQVRVGELEGRAVDVDDSGALLIETTSGLRRVDSGDVRMIGQI